MINVITSEKKPIKLWLHDMEAGALEQAQNLANLPFVFKHVAIMPDSHQGYGMPIGGVLATRGVIIPNAVGVDIGCGMCAVKSNLKRLAVTDLKTIVEKIKERIPVGFNWHTEPQSEDLMPALHETNNPIAAREYEKALLQLGTLGGGNHFIEIQKGSDGFIWVMIHSGSRNIGKQVADYYNKAAVALNEQWCSAVPKEWRLAFLPMNSKEGKLYRSEMQYCVDFALANRKHMMSQVIDIFYNMALDIEFDDMINIAHNYAAMENHYKSNVMVHRKGATQANSGQLGIIPGSQGTKSYIVKGKGNPESFRSCSHGAGRVMGRKQAIRELKLEDELERMGDVIHSIASESDLDEAPSAYKDIDTVMANQKDLVDIVVELTPLAVVKG